MYKLYFPQSYLFCETGVIHCSLADKCFVFAATDLVSRQVVHCHRVLRTVQLVAEKSTAISSTTWDTLLRFLLAVNDVLLAPPTEKGLHCLALHCIFCFGRRHCI